MTDISGTWWVADLDAGEYTVEFLAPAGFDFTLPNEGTDETLDSDADPVTGRTAPFVLTEGRSDFSVDAGLFDRASVGCEAELMQPIQRVLGVKLPGGADLELSWSPDINAEGGYNLRFATDKHEIPAYRGSPVRTTCRAASMREGTTWPPAVAMSEA